MKPKNQITPDELKRYFGNASASTLKANSQDHAHDSRKTPKLESNLVHAPLEEKKLQRGLQEKYLIRFTSIRKKLLDTDNLCSKYVTDLLRYSKIIVADDPQQALIQTGQIKCKKEEEEHVNIQIDVYEISHHQS